MNNEQTYMPNTTDSLIPWYKQFWPWVLIMLPGSVVIACIITIVLSIKYSDDLVVGDYYRAGLDINKQIKKQDAAKKLNIVALFELDNTNYDREGNLINGILRCNLSSSKKINSNYLIFYFRHSNSEILDKTVILNRLSKTNIFEASNLELAKGSYYLTLESGFQEWQITQQIKQVNLLKGLIIKIQ